VQHLKARDTTEWGSHLKYHKGLRNIIFCRILKPEQYYYLLASIGALEDRGSGDFPSKKTIALLRPAIRSLQSFSAFQEPAYTGVLGTFRHEVTLIATAHV
jgi:hypothetical protein